jgi:hypothetical protein
MKNPWGQFEETAVVEELYPDHGFVYINDTRIIFYPLEIDPEADEADDETLVLQSTNWGEPTSWEIGECEKALAATHPDRKIFIAQDLDEEDDFLDEGEEIINDDWGDKQMPEF